MRGSRIALLIVGVLLVVIGLGTGVASAVAGWAHLVQRDGDGFVTTPDVDLASEGHAVVSDNLEVVVGPADWFPWNDDLDLRLRVTAEDPEQAVFAGIAATEDVEVYLDDVGHDRVTAFDFRRPRYVGQAGTRTPPAPAEQPFWLAQAEGSGTQDLTWSPVSGEWTVVVMNADGTAGVAVEAAAGVQTGLLGPLGLWLLLSALALVGGGTALVILGVREDEHAAPSDPSASDVPVVGAHPVAITGHLDTDLSRGLWLVKWAMLIPHVVVLMVLGTVFVALTVVAGVSILFTGRYPRRLFDINVGVLRWAWRVAFFGYGVLGTDQYPPFTLAPADYPAQLDIVYPQRLSRGLVLVKSWLLALPHLLIVGLLTSGWASWAATTRDVDGIRFSVGGGLIGVLVLIAGLSLLFRARYPRGLFDLVMGLNRWVFRVIAYVALMTDTYPPFRLDLGGDEPPAPPSPPPASPASPATARPESVHTHA